VGDGGEGPDEAAAVGVTAQGGDGGPCTWVGEGQLERGDLGWEGGKVEGVGEVDKELVWVGYFSVDEREGVQVGEPEEGDGVEEVDERLVGGIGVAVQSVC